MMVLALTAFVGLALVTCFVFLFICQSASGGSLEHEALLPLTDESLPQPAAAVSKPSIH